MNIFSGLPHQFNISPLPLPPENGWRGFHTEKQSLSNSTTATDETNSPHW